jgi:hypothetical protein
MKNSCCHYSALYLKSQSPSHKSRCSFLNYLSKLVAPNFARKDNKRWFQQGMYIHSLICLPFFFSLRAHGIWSYQERTQVAMVMLPVPLLKNWRSSSGGKKMGKVFYSLNGVVKQSQTEVGWRWTWQAAENCFFFFNF